MPERLITPSDVLSEDILYVSGGVITAFTDTRELAPYLQRLTDSGIKTEGSGTTIEWKPPVTSRNRSGLLHSMGSDGCKLLWVTVSQNFPGVPAATALDDAPVPSLEQGVRITIKTRDANRPKSRSTRTETFSVSSLSSPEDEPKVRYDYLPPEEEGGRSKEYESASAAGEAGVRSVVARLEEFGRVAVKVVTGTTALYTPYGSITASSSEASVKAGGSIDDISSWRPPRNRLVTVVTDKDTGDAHLLAAAWTPPSGSSPRYSALRPEIVELRSAHGTLGTDGAWYPRARNAWDGHITSSSVVRHKVASQELLRRAWAQADPTRNL